MFIARIEIQGRERETIELDAAIDTGFTGGLWLPRELAERVGAAFVRPVRYPKTIDGRALRGRATALTVRFVGTDLGAEVPVFCPSAAMPGGDVLVGSYLLASVHARVVISDVVYMAATRAKPNRAQRFDFGDWVLPTNRAVTPWW